ncbi:MAG: flagellar protein FlaG [Thermodesulfovibrionales bacterium]|nr:flagellar protein FlaG [Thermodesulfovibrionales bacterium]
MADININTNINNALTNNYNQKTDIQKNVAVGVNPESTSAFNSSVMSGRSAVRPVNNNESKPNNLQTAEKERANANKNDNNNSPQKSIQLEFDKTTGYPVIKFRDTKGNVVSQVPPEQFLKMRSVLGYNSRKEEVVDNNNALYSRKVGGEENLNQQTNETQKGQQGSSKENNLSLYI